MLAANARLLLLAYDERHRLEGDARQIRRAAAVRESSERSHVLVRRADWRIEQWPHLCRRRRASGHAAHQAWPVGRRIFTRPGYTRIPHRTHFTWRKLEQADALAAHGCRRKRKSRRLHSRDQQHAGAEFAKPL